MMAGPKYSEKQKEQFFDLIDRGGTVRAAAAIIGVHPDAAYTWLRVAGLTMRRATPRIYTQAEKSAFFGLLAERQNVSAVARELGFTRVTCYKWAHQAGIFTSEATKVNPRREEFLRLRAEGLSRAEAAERVRADKRLAADWDKGITIINRGRVYPDGRVVRYRPPIRSGVTTARTTPAIGGRVDLDRVEKVIDSRYLSLLERERIRDLHRTGMSMRGIASELRRRGKYCRRRPLVARAQAVRERRNTLQLLRMSIVAAPDEVRDQVRNLTRMQLIRHLAAWRPDVSHATDPVVAYRVALKSFGRRYLELTDEIADLDDLINPIVEALAPQLLERVGIGIEVAGQLLVTAGDNPDRMKSEAAFAMLCGVSPLPASSGMTQRHRLNRGGDRQANRALHLAVISRLRLEPRTKAYVAKKTAEEHSKMEIIRCLKRYLAREVYFLLNPGIEHITPNTKPRKIAA